jgi:hypothetical protein
VISISIDSTKFRAPFLTIPEIWSQVEIFRKKYWPSGKVPVDIIKIVEFRLKLKIEARYYLREQDTDALLLGDLDTILVDRQYFMDDRYLSRLRFSIAHEIGHLILHSQKFTEIAHASIDDWVSFIQLIPDDQYRWMELHANEFAGRLLVPHDYLEDQLKSAIRFAEDRGFVSWDISGDTARGYIANRIASAFEVSNQVIATRLLREQLWPPRK